jgi:hypothetical protein
MDGIGKRMMVGLLKVIIVIGLEFPVAFFGVGVLLQLSYHRTR